MKNTNMKRLNNVKTISSYGLDHILFNCLNEDVKMKNSVTTLSDIIIILEDGDIDFTYYYQNDGEKLTIKEMMARFPKFSFTDIHEDWTFIIELIKPTDLELY